MVDPKKPIPQNTTNRKLTAVGRNGTILVLGGVAIVSALKLKEGQELTTYPDKFAKGLPTFCSGRTSWDVPIGTKFTQEECDLIDRETTIEYGLAVLNCTNHIYLTQDVLDALTLFAVNVGKAGACGSRAVKLINTGNLEKGCEAIAIGPDGKAVWSYANGVFVKGLANRRWFEANWCLKATKVI